LSSALERLKSAKAFMTRRINVLQKSEGKAR